MPVIKDINRLPARDQATAARINDTGLHWEYEPRYPLVEPSQVRRVQVRDVNHLARPADVARYKEALLRSEELGAGIVTLDGVYVDFNTRALGAWQSGARHYPVFIIQTRIDSASVFEKNLIHMLGAGCNTRNGQNLTGKEEVDAVRAAIAAYPDWPQAKVAAILSLTKSRAAQAFATIKAENRARQLGVPFATESTNGTRATPVTMVRMLGQATDKLNDAPFRELCLLVQDSGMASSDLSALLARVKAAGSDDEKLRFIAAERQAREAQILHFRATGKRGSSLASEMRRYFSFLSEHQANDLVDPNPTTSHQYLWSLEHVVGLLTRTADAQRRLVEGPTA